MAELETKGWTGFLSSRPAASRSSKCVGLVTPTYLEQVRGTIELADISQG